MMKSYTFQLKQEISPRQAHTVRLRAADISRQGFLQSKRRSFVFVYAMNAEGLEGCVLLNPVIYQQADWRAVVGSFLSALGFQELRDKGQTVPEEESINLLFRAFREGFAAETDEVLDAFGLLRLRETWGGVTTAHSGSAKDALLASAGKFSAMPSLAQEVERIFTETTHPVCAGHPTHYLVEMPKGEGHEEVVDILMSSLYARRRVQRKRYTTLRYCADIGDFTDGFLGAVEACAGGALVLDFISHQKMWKYDEDNAGPMLLSDFSHSYMHNRVLERDVLLVLCFNHVDNNIKEILREAFPHTQFLLIGQEKLDRDAAKARLNQLALETGAVPDQELYQPMEEKAEGCTLAELNEIFGAWYKSYLKRVAYPQYAQLSNPLKRQEKDAEEVGLKQKDSYAKLQAMVGLSSAKREIDKVLSAHRARKLYKKMGIQAGTGSMHMMFTGNPGTAKTSVARLYAQILKEEGVLSKGELIEVGRSDLVGKYVGWTARLVSENFRKARGSVLFIDEAYALADNLSGRGFGKEAIDTIVLEMENHREDMVVILAGYPEEMESMLSYNPGLRSRIGFHISFEDYNPEEMMQILRSMAEDQGLVMDEAVSAGVMPWFAQASGMTDLGNGRFVRNLLDKARMNQAERLLTLDEDELTEESVRLLLPEDFECPLIPKKKTALIGFQ